MNTAAGCWPHSLDLGERSNLHGNCGLYSSAILGMGRIGRVRFLREDVSEGCSRRKINRLRFFPLFVLILCFFSGRVFERRELYNEGRIASALLDSITLNSVIRWWIFLFIGNYMEISRNEIVLDCCCTSLIYHYLWVWWSNSSLRIALIALKKTVSILELVQSRVENQRRNITMSC